MNTLSHPTCDTWEKKIEEMQRQTKLDILALSNLGNLINEFIDTCIKNDTIREDCRKEVASIYESIGREGLYEHGFKECCK